MHIHKIIEIAKIRQGWIHTLEQLIELGTQRLQQAHTPEEQAKVTKALGLIYESYRMAELQLETIPHSAIEMLPQGEQKPAWLLDATFDNCYLRQVV